MIDTLTASDGIWTSTAILAAVTFAAAWAATRLIMSRLQIYDRPNARSAHVEPTPKAGGLAVVGVWIFAVFVAYSLNGEAAFELPEPAIWTFLALVVFMCMVSLVDDVMGMAALLKLAFQALVASIFVLAVASLQAFPVPGHGDVELGWFGPVLTIVWIVGFMNVFNFMDGINGLAAGVAALASLALAGLAAAAGADLVFLCAVTLAPALAGFLVFNFPNGRVFLGDNGSQPIGFALAALAVIGAQPAAPEATGSAIPFLAVALLFLPFLFDVAATLGHRLTRKQNLLEAHNEHLYQILCRSGYAHAEVACVYYLLTGACAVGAALMVRTAPADQLILLLAFIPLAAALALGVFVQGRRCGVIAELRPRERPAERLEPTHEADNFGELEGPVRAAE